MTTTTIVDIITSNAVISTLALGAVGSAIALVMAFSGNNKKTDEKPLPVAPAGSKFIELPGSGVTLRYTDIASDDKSKSGGFDKNNTKQLTFLLLHGFGGVLETWEFLTPYLLESKTNDTKETTKIRVVAIDFVGSGFSDKPDGTEFDYAYRSQGRVVSEFISVLDLSNVVLVGHSSGTVVGASTAVQKSKGGENSAVVGAIFMSCALFRSKSEYFSKPWLKPVLGWMVTKMTGNRKKSLGSMHLPVHADRVLTDEFVEKFAAPTRLPNFHVALLETVMAKEAPYEDLVDELLSLPSLKSGDENEGTRAPVPMLFVWGKQDTYKPLPDEQKESIRQKLDVMDANAREEQRVETAELEECHHYPQHEQPEALAKEILGFVQKSVTLQ